jgi:hypothetical protein
MQFLPASPARHDRPLPGRLRRDQQNGHVRLFRDGDVRASSARLPAPALAERPFLRQYPRQILALRLHFLRRRP